MSKNWKIGRWLSWFTILLSLIQESNTSTFIKNANKNDAIGCLTPEGLLNSGQVKHLKGCRELECQVLSGGIEVIIEKRCPLSVEATFIDCEAKDQDILFPECCFSICQSKHNSTSFKENSSKVKVKEFKKAYAIPSHRLINQELRNFISSDLGGINKRLTERNRRFAQPREDKSTTLKPSFYLPSIRRKQKKDISIDSNEYIPKMMESIFARKQNLKENRDASKDMIDGKIIFDPKKTSDYKETKPHSTSKQKDIYGSNDNHTNRASNSKTFRGVKSMTLLRKDHKMNESKQRGLLSSSNKENFHTRRKQDSSKRRLRPIRRFNSKLLSQETRNNASHSIVNGNTKLKQNLHLYSSKRQRPRKFPLIIRRTSSRTSRAKFKKKQMLPIVTYEPKTATTSSSVKTINISNEPMNEGHSVELQVGKNNSKLPTPILKNTKEETLESKSLPKEHRVLPNKTQQRSHFDNSRQWVKEVSRSYNSNWSSKTPEKLHQKRKQMYKYISKDSGNSPTDYNLEKLPSQIQLTKRLARPLTNSVPNIKAKNVNETKSSVIEFPLTSDPPKTDKEVEISYGDFPDEYTHDIPDFDEFYSSISKEYKEYTPIVDLNYSSNDEDITETKTDKPNEPHTTFTFHRSRKYFVAKESSNSAKNSGDDPHYKSQTQYEVIQYP